ncbi:hypothetical protein MRX96_030731 [Rhipicephalus microplus]
MRIARPGVKDRFCLVTSPVCAQATPSLDLAPQFHHQPALMVLSAAVLAVENERRLRSNWRTLSFPLVHATDCCQAATAAIAWYLRCDNLRRYEFADRGGLVWIVSPLGGISPSQLRGLCEAGRDARSWNCYCRPAWCSFPGHAGNGRKRSCFAAPN